MGTHGATQRADVDRNHFRVSVVIPSFRRHQEVQIAVRSALGQTYRPHEIIVVNDGEDVEKRRLIEALKDPVVQYVEAPRTGSAAATRNFGVANAKGDWIALLDDDDAWQADKLEQQISRLISIGGNECVLACQEEYLIGGSKAVRPVRPPKSAVGAQECLFTSMQGMSTSTIVAPRHWFESVPMRDECGAHEDWQWLLDISARFRANIVFVEKVLCYRQVRVDPIGLTSRGGFDSSFCWYVHNKDTLQKSSRAYLIANTLSRKAAYEGRLRFFPLLAFEIIKAGFPGVRQAPRFLVSWGVPYRVRVWLKALVGTKPRA